MFALNHYTRPRTLVVDRKKSADAWWQPMNADAEEMGQCLAEAQLGNIWAALKLPGLMARRQKTVIDFVRNPGHPIEKMEMAKNLKGRISWGAVMAKIGNFLIPPMMNFELEWGYAAVTAIFSGEDLVLKPLSKVETIAFLKDFYTNMPFPANLSVRAAFWSAGLAPLFMKKSLRRFHHLPLEERIEILNRFSSSDSYLLRQMTIMLKMCGSLSYTSTTRFHNATSTVSEGGHA